MSQARVIKMINFITIINTDTTWPKFDLHSIPPVSRFAPIPGRPESFRPDSLSPWVVSPSFINSALKNENGKYNVPNCKYSYFGCCKACSWVLYFN